MGGGTFISDEPIDQHATMSNDGTYGMTIFDGGYLYVKLITSS